MGSPFFFASGGDSELAGLHTMEKSGKWIPLGGRKICCSPGIGKKCKNQKGCIIRLNGRRKTDFMAHSTTRRLTQITT